MHLAHSHDAPTLDDLCKALIEAKAAAYQANASVLTIEKKIVELVGSRDEGSFSVECDGYKITTTQPIRRTVDADKARAISAMLPRDIADTVFRWKPELNTSVYKNLREFQPTTFDQVCEAVTAKPGKVSLKVEALA